MTEPEPVNQKLPNKPDVLPVVRVAPLGELRVYQVTEDELNALQRGRPSDLFLNFSLSLLSITVSLFTTFATATFSADRTFYVFVIISVVSLIAGVVLLILWARYRSDAKEIVGTIKNRMPPQPAVENIDETQLRD